MAKVWSHEYFQKKMLPNLQEEEKEEEEEQSIPLLPIEGQEDTEQEHQMQEEQL